MQSINTSVLANYVCFGFVSAIFIFPFYMEMLTSLVSCSGDTADPGARAGLSTARADDRLQAHEATAPEAAAGIRKQTKDRDGRAPAQAGQRAGEPEEQFQQRG